MKKLLHVGCGQNRIKQTTVGFQNGLWKEIRLDIDPKNNPDIVGNIMDMQSIQNSSIDAIFSSHNLEHLYYHEVLVALAEFRRVLNTTGFCIITCPDLQSVSSLIANDKLLDTAYPSAVGPITPLDILYGHSQSILQGNYYMAHRCGFTKKTLEQILLQSGFKSVKVKQRPDFFDLWALATQDLLSPTLLENLAKNHFPT